MVADSTHGEFPYSDRLKLETVSSHKQLEKMIGFPLSFQNLDSYRRVLRFFFLFQSQVNLFLPVYSKQLPENLHIERRGKLPLVIADMQHMHVFTEEHANQLSLSINSISEFYGSLYVQEGATLGGVFIRNYMLKKYGESAINWTSYLSPYGNDCKRMWDDFRNCLEQQINIGQIDFAGVADGAKKTFRYLLRLADELHEAESNSEPVVNV